MPLPLPLTAPSPLPVPFSLPPTPHTPARTTDNGPEFLLHAVVCCTVFCVACAKGIMHYYGAAFLMWELSTPFMYLR